MTDKTSILPLLESAAIDLQSAPELLYKAYGQLRALAQSYLRAERRDHTLQATALVHEAYLRLVGSSSVNWESPAEFFAATAETMRRILIDHARAHGRLKRGGGRQRMELKDFPLIVPDDPDDFLRLDAAIDRLASIEPETAQVVRLRFLVGLEVEDTAGILGVSARTIKRQWQWARTWLHREISRAEPGHEPSPAKP